MEEGHGYGWRFTGMHQALKKEMKKTGMKLCNKPGKSGKKHPETGTLVGSS